MNLKTITTKLETAQREDIAFILNGKAEAVGANATVDYIGMALDNIDSAKERIKNAIAELTEIRKSLESQEAVIKIGVSEWLTSNGIEKLQGDRISSISILEKKESKELIVDNEEACINAGHFKMVIDKTSVKNALFEGDFIDGAHIETVHNEPSIRLNKKREKANTEVIVDESQSA
jgi:hypothetical protein